MSSRVFVDTKILVYTCDRSEPHKQRQALQILEQLTLSGSGVINTQVLAEFFVTVTSSEKFSSPMSAAESYEYLQDYISSWEVVNITALIVLEAGSA